MKFKEFLKEAGSKYVEPSDENIKKLAEWLKDYTVGLFYHNDGRYGRYRHQSGELNCSINEQQAKKLIEEWNSNESFSVFSPIIFRMKTGISEFKFPPLFDLNNNEALTTKIEIDSNFNSSYVVSFEEFPKNTIFLIKRMTLKSFRGVDKLGCKKLTLQNCTVAKDAPVLALFKDPNLELKMIGEVDEVINVLVELKADGADMAEASEALIDAGFDGNAKL